MKKAFVDQILLTLFIFVMLIIIGATINDVTQARDKYYNLKKITDNGALTLAKYYTQVAESTSAAQATYNAMLTETKLGNEVRNIIQYTWDFTSTPNTVTVTIPTYVEDTFWFRFLGTNAFNLVAESVATIELEETTDPRNNFSAGLGPFAINDRNVVIGDTLDLTYAITAGWQYSDKDTFYPMVTNCDCDCDFILSDRFDFSSIDINYDVNNCNATSSACTSHGESEFRDYSKLIDDVYNSGQSIDFDQGETSSPLCLLGTYLGNTTSTWGTQINHLSDGIFELIGSTGQNLPLQMDLITLGEDGIANGILRVEITGYDFVLTSNPDNRYITLNTTAVASRTEQVRLIK